MRLGDFILRDMELILQRWETFAGTCLPAAEHMSSVSLRDHGAEILRAIVADLATPQSPRQQVIKSKGLTPVVVGAPHTAAQTHALLRAESGFHVDQLVAEYRALRASVLSAWIEACAPQPPSPEEMLRFNEAIDQAVAESIGFFAAQYTRSNNLLLGNLHDAFRRAQDANDALAREHAELEHLVAERTHALAHALELAESANRAKNAFLRTISHELRTPLNAVIGFSRLMLDGSIDQPLETQRQPLAMIERSGQELLTLVREMLDITSIEAGDLTVALTSVDLRQALEEVRESMLRMAAERKLELRAVACSDDLRVMADRQRLVQVIRNLLSNALKFTDHGFVQIRASPHAGLIRVEIEDTGIGIPADQRTFLFQPFNRITGEASRLRPGTGLGLAIGLRLVEAMGGTMGFESEEGRGSRFWFTLPSAPHA